MMKRLLASCLAFLMLASTLMLSPGLLAFAEEERVLFSEDFDDEARVNGYTRSKISYAASGDASHNGVGKVTDMGCETGRGSAWPTYLRLRTGDVDKLLLEPGETYTFSYDVKRNSLNDTVKVKLIFADNMGNLSYTGNGVDHTTNDTNTLTLRTISAGTDADFVHYVDTFTVPENFSAEAIAKGANLAFIKTGTANKFDCEILLDNFLLEKGVPPERIDTLITFDDDAQKAHYGSSANASQTTLVSDDASHGSALQITRISMNGSGDFSYQYPARLNVFRTDTGKALVAETGAMYRVEFDLKASKTYGEYALYAQFDEGSAMQQNGHSAQQTTSELLGSFSANLCDWTHHVFTFIAPTDKPLFLLFHLTTRIWVTTQKDWDVRLDNIRVQKVTPCRVKLHANNGTDEVVEYDAYTGLPVDELPVPTPPEESTFEGWYLDASLTQRAETVAENGEYWANWTSTAPVQQVTYNTFEHEGIAYDNTRAPESKSTRVEEADGNHIYRYVVAERNTSQWPATVMLYDSEKLEARFYPRSNAAYRIRFRYRVNARPDRKLVFQLLRIGRLSNPTNPNAGYSADNLYLSEIAAVTEPTADWQTVEKIFYTPADGKDWFLSLNLVSADDSNAKDVNVDVDDIEIEQVIDGARYFTFDTTGGDPLDRQICVAGDNVPSLPIPQKDGFYFEGWFLDDACVTPFAESIMPDRDMTLYAAWTQLPVGVTSFSTGFEPTDYDAPPYANTDAATAKSDQNMSAAAVWHNNSITDAYGGQGFVSLTNTPEQLSQSNSAAWHSLSLINRDGSRFKVVAGQRYHLTYAFQVMQSSGQVVNLVVSEYTPVQGIQTNHCTVLHSMSYSELYTGVSPTEWGVCDVYFLAQKTGNVYFSYYSTQTDDHVCLDDVTVEPVTEAQAPIVTYYDENGAVLSEAIAAPGSLLTPAGGQHKDGYAFDGWRDEDGNRYLSNYFPNRDLKLYPSFKALPAGSDGHTDWKNQVTVDFEQTADAMSFYGDLYNTDSAVYGPYFMVNDPENAHSGNNYFYFYKMGMWVEQWYRRMRFFGKDTPGHVITLDPQSVYKVSYWIRVDDLTSAGNLFLALYDESDKDMKAGTYIKGAENYMTPDVIIERLGQWYRVESLVMTPQDAYTTIGFVFYGGYLTAAIDDITITKLHDVTVTFETNGGTPIDPVIQLSQDYVIEPVAPERPGFVFDGWYTDPAFQNRFRFTETLVNSDLKLYAKWVAAPEPPGPTYKTRYEYDTDYVTETVTTPPEPADPALDAALGILPDTDSDLPAQTEKPTAQGLPWWAILLICVGGVLVAAGAATGILLAVKRSEKGGKGNA